MLTLEDNRKNKVEYDQLFVKIELCVKKSPEHFRLLREEKKLVVHGIKIKRELRIFANDPCGSMFCRNGCNLENIRSCRYLQKKVGYDKQRWS